MKWLFSIEDFSDQENLLIKQAPTKYGEVYTNTNDLLSLLLNFTSGVIDPDAWIFIGFLSQVQKSLLLAFLSTLRQHDVQTLMMLRMALESTVLAAYSLYQTDVNVYGKINPQGFMDINKKTKDKAYKWIDREFGSHSKILKFFKEEINSNSAHANFGLIFNNLDFSTETFLTKHLFDDNEGDKEHHFIITMQRLWWIGNISFGLLSLFEQVIKKYPLIQLVDDFGQMLAKHGIENDRIKEKLQKHPRFLILPK